MNNQPIRVAQVIGKWLGGGVESVIMNYYRNIDRTKIQFDFICDDDSKFIPYDEIRELGGRVYIIPSYKKLFSYISELRKVLRKNKYLIVHSHLSTLSIFPLYAAKRENVPIRIAHSHSTYSWKELSRTIIKFLLRPFSKVFATNYFACSKEAGEFLFGKNTVKKNKVHIMYNAIDIDKFRYNSVIRDCVRSKLNIDNNTVVLGHVGRFVKTKNHEFLIEVFAKYHSINPNSILILIGKGDLENIIRQKILDLNLSKSIIFLGYRNDINEIYQAMDIFLLPSLYEGLGMTLIEAQMSGLPCIASTNVPLESNICNLVKFVNLDVDDWCNNIEKLVSYNRSYVDCTNSGYSIGTEAINLANTYNDYISNIK